MNLYIASDHAGVTVKEKIIKDLKENFKSLTVIDLGPSDSTSVDYPLYAKTLCEKMLNDPKFNSDETRGILICGSGIGMSIAANRFQKIRAALVFENELAVLCREHNDSNVLCLAAKFLSIEKINSLVKIFLNTKFLGDRHAKRVNQLDTLT